jgi:hypothetical protein
MDLAGSVVTAPDSTEPEPADLVRHVVEVNEIRVFATRRGADWWAWFLLAYRSTDRITVVAVSLGGAICHVACDSRDHAVWLATSMVDQHGLPKSAVRARALPLREDG